MLQISHTFSRHYRSSRRSCFRGLQVRGGIIGRHEPPPPHPRSANRLERVAGILCLLLIALWVRNYQVPLRLIRPNMSEATGVVSNRGRFTVGRFELNNMQRMKPPSSEYVLEQKLAADQQYAVLSQKLMLEQFRLETLRKGTRGLQSRQIAAQQRKVVGLQQMKVQYRTQYALTN